MRHQYYHTLEWSESAHPMSSFRNPSPQLGYQQQYGGGGQVNAYGRGANGQVGLYPPNPPTLPFKTRDWHAGSTKLGELDVAGELVDKLGSGAVVRLEPGAVRRAPSGALSSFF